MTPAQLRAKVLAERTAWARQMVAGIRSLPLESLDSFHSDPRNAAAAESYLRRGLEALLDLGRHILAKGFGRAALEYKDIARILGEEGVLDESASQLLTRLAGYRNRMVHFYHEVSESELYGLCTTGLDDVEGLLAALLRWVEDHPERVDRSL
jgi:uncharacterized protein YutE (UPF0331/DUF86 family)